VVDSVKDGIVEIIAELSGVVRARKIWLNWLVASVITN
jgi:hypothetical protein